MELGTKEVEDGSQVAEKAGHALKVIIETIDQANRRIEEIKQVVQEVAVSGQQVVDYIDGVAAVTEQNTLPVPRKWQPLSGS